MPSLSQKRRKIPGESLKWRSVKTSKLPGMDDSGGMMMLEELDGVDVEWEEGAGGSKTARFIEVGSAQDSASEGENVDATASEVQPKSGRKGKGRAAAIPLPTSIITGHADSDDEEYEEGDEEEFVGFPDSSDTGEEEDDEAEEEEDEEEEDEEDAGDLPDFSKTSIQEVNDEDGEEVVTAEPSFDDDLLPEWKDIALHNSLKRALLASSFVNPTDIQRRALGPGLAGRDVVGVAETGSGKTLAYSLPILSYLLRSPLPNSKARRSLSALILCPTRELALQVSEHLNRLLKHIVAMDADEESSTKKSGPPRVSIGSVVGGLSAQKQKRIVERGCDILVATPGRMWDLMKTDDELAASVRTLRFLVIDEADRMIENGHFAELESIVGLTQRNASQNQQSEDAEDPTFAVTASLLTTTAARDDMQTFVFSATMSKDLQKNLKRRAFVSKKGKGKKASALEDLVEKLDFRDEKPEVIDLSPEGGVVASLRESMVECVASDKDLYLYYFLLRYPGRSLVFVGSIDGIRRLIPLFEVLQVPVYPLHSQLQQKQRLKNLDRFKNDPKGVLIATDVAARGLDIPQVDHVIHFNLPRTADAYIHRSGRTARAQNEGFALQLCSAEEKGMQKALMNSLGRPNDLPDLPMDSGFLPKLKERIRLAKAIEKAQHMVKKDNHDKNWLKETAEAMDIDLDPDMLSEASDDPDLPFHQTKKRSRSNKTSSTALINLKNELRARLSETLMARGVSAKYPTGGSRIVVDELLKNTGHSTMLGASTKKAYDEIESINVKKSKPAVAVESKTAIKPVETQQKKKVRKSNSAKLDKFKSLDQLQDTASIEEQSAVGKRKRL